MDRAYLLMESLVCQGINEDLTAEWLDELGRTGQVSDDLRGRADDAAQWCADLYNEHRDTLFDIRYG